MKILIINHFAGIPKYSDFSLRHYYFAKYFKEKDFECSIITSKQNYQSREKVDSSKKLIEDIEYFFIDEPDMMSKLKKGGVLSISLPTDPGIALRLGRLFIRIFSIKKT